MWLSSLFIATSHCRPIKHRTLSSCPNSESFVLKQVPDVYQIASVVIIVRAEATIIMTVRSHHTTF